MLKYLPDSYYTRLTGTKPRKIDDHLTQVIKNGLRPFGLQDLEDKNATTLLPLPESFGSIKEELQDAYKAYDSDWESMLALVTGVAPVLPDNYDCPVGWSYWQNGKWHILPKVPSGKVMILDFETVKMPNGQWHPTCCVCMSAKGWLVWKTDFDTIHLNAVTPFSTNNAIMGYNVSYDRALLAPEYLLEPSENKFYDLMSMWVVVGGMSNQQRPVYLLNEGKETQEDTYDLSIPQWVNNTSSNGLAAVYAHYTGKSLDKGVRDGIVDLGLPWVKDNMASVIQYCLLDVLATHELAGHLMPAYALRRPSKISRYGSIALGSCWLPLSQERFEGYHERCQAVHLGNKENINAQLLSVAKAYLTRYPTKDDCPLGGTCLDWTEAKAGVSKGLPAWYRTIVSECKKGTATLSKRWAPAILEMTLGGKPLFYTDGWQTEDGYVVHPSVRGAKVHDMFLKDFLEQHESGNIGSPDYVKPLIAAKVSTINWVSLEKRVASIHTESPEGHPVTIPQMVVNGTVTGRATDPIWQVCPNPKEKRVGTELKSMVAPFEGYSFVGADVASQEGWLAACHGDQALGIAGSTPFGLMTIIGTSKDKTDIHSVVAAQTGFSRTVTKSRVYGACYGQGIKGDSSVIMRNDPLLSEAKARLDSQAFLNLFKGHRSGSGYIGGLASACFTQMEKLADGHQPRTPLTGAFMSVALAGVKDYKPTRVNWIVQASGVDFRDMLVLLTQSFYAKMGVKGRLVLTIHD